MPLVPNVKLFPTLHIHHTAPLSIPDIGGDVQSQYRSLFCSTLAQCHRRPLHTDNVGILRSPSRLDPMAPADIFSISAPNDCPSIDRSSVRRWL